METLSIAPAVALMYPAAIPFICVLLLLSSIRLLPKKWLKSPLLVADLVILSGILLVFAVFDPGSIRHFLIRIGQWTGFRFSPPQSSF